MVCSLIGVGIRSISDSEMHKEGGNSDSQIEPLSECLYNLHLHLYQCNSTLQLSFYMWTYIGKKASLVFSPVTEWFLNMIL